MAKVIRVSAAIIEHRGDIFCARKAPGKPLAGFWEFPGGKIEPGESPESCLKRELQEELSIETRIQSYFATSRYQDVDKIIELIAFRVRWESGDIKLIDHDSSCWRPVSQLEELKWAPADVPLVDKLRRDFNDE